MVEVWRTLTPRRLLLSVLLCALALLTVPALTAEASASTGTGPERGEAQTLEMLLQALPARYEAAHSSHDVVLALPVREIAGLIRARVARNDVPPAASALPTLDRLVHSLHATRERFDPWPLGFEVERLAKHARLQLGDTAAGHAPASYTQVDAELERLGAHPSQTLALRVYALYASGPGLALLSADPTLDDQIGEGLLGVHPGTHSLSGLIAEGASRTRIVQATTTVRSEVNLAAQVLGLVKISRTTIVVNGAIIVFREGLEAVLILAAITASFVGAKRHLRRPVLLGALMGLGATVLTWVVAQLLLHLLGNGGLQLQAATGLVAIGVLLLVTNWFFHRVYWSQWISRFNRRRKAIERLDRVGFLSGQALGLVVLGLSSVYREGLETVLFLQAMQSSAGTGAAALGAGIGLGATLIVGLITFKLQRKLPFKRMLILTGVMIALVLAVMVGTTVHNMQGVGWLASTKTSFDVPLDWSTWLGVYPTWQGIGAQLTALVFVLGSYFAAREIQVKRPQRRAARAQSRQAPTPAVAHGASTSVIRAASFDA
jgi:FTR1 family protein